MKQGDAIVLGARYKDRVLGLIGVATVHCRHMTGCDTVRLEWEKDGKAEDAWVDILRLEFVAHNSDLEGLGETAPIGGGPAPHPPARSHG